MNPRIIYALNQAFRCSQGMIKKIEQSPEGSLKIKLSVHDETGANDMYFAHSGVDTMQNYFSQKWPEFFAIGSEEEAIFNDLPFESDFLSADPSEFGTLIIENPQLAHVMLGFFHQIAQEIKRPTWKLLDELIKQFMSGQNAVRITHAPEDNFNLNECLVLRTFFRAHPEFNIQFSKQINNASSSSVMLSGGPQGLIFTLTSPNGSFMEGLLKAKKHLASFCRSEKTLINMILQEGYTLGAGAPFDGVPKEKGISEIEMQRLLEFFNETHPELGLLATQPFHSFPYEVIFKEAGWRLRAKLEEALEIIQNEEIEEQLGNVKNAAKVS